MGICMCPVHGRSFLAHVCPHIREAVGAKTPFPRRTTYTFSIGEKTEIVMKLHFCDRCVAERRLPSLPRPLTESEVDREEFATDVVCRECFLASEGSDTLPT